MASPNPPSINAGILQAQYQAVQNSILQMRASSEGILKEMRDLISGRKIGGESDSMSSVFSYPVAVGQEKDTKNKREAQLMVATIQLSSWYSNTVLPFFGKVAAKLDLLERRLTKISRKIAILAHFFSEIQKCLALIQQKLKQRKSKLTLLRGSTAASSSNDPSSFGGLLPSSALKPGSFVLPSLGLGLLPLAGQQGSTHHQGKHLEGEKKEEENLLLRNHFLQYLQVSHVLENESTGYVAATLGTKVHIQSVYESLILQVHELKLRLQHVNNGDGRSSSHRVNPSSSSSSPGMKRQISIQTGFGVQLPALLAPPHRGRKSSAQSGGGTSTLAPQQRPVVVVDVTPLKKVLDRHHRIQASAALTHTTTSAGNGDGATNIVDSSSSSVQQQLLSSTKTTLEDLSSVLGTQPDLEESELRAAISHGLKKATAIQGTRLTISDDVVAPLGL